MSDSENATASNRENLEDILPGPINDLKPRRGRAPIACQSCHLRRVRCDGVFRTNGCTNCTLDGPKCFFPRGKADVKRLNRAVHRSQARKDTSLGIGTSSLEKSTNNHDLRAREKRKSICTYPTKPNYISHHEFAVLKGKGVFYMPRLELRREMIRAYIRYLYGILPVLDARDLAVIGGSEDKLSCFSNWFMLIAFFAIAIKFVDSNFARQYGMDSLDQSSRGFFGKAETLYRFRWEGDKYSFVQGLLFLGFHDKDLSAGDSFHWIWMAYLTAVSIKLNFEPATGPQREQRLRRRLWWSCYTQCCLSNIDAKSRSQITVSEGQINPPTFDDFAQDSTLNLIPESFDPSFPVNSSAFVFIERVKLLRIYNEIISIAKPRQGHDLVAPAISANIENIVQYVTNPI